MQIGDLVKHLPERVSSRRAKWFGIVVGFDGGMALVDWLNEGLISYHPPPHLEVLCK
jgi:hypothetical protein